MGPKRAPGPTIGRAGPSACPGVLLLADDVLVDRALRAFTGDDSPRCIDTAKGSRPFQAATGDGPALFVKVFGSDQRDAGLLYRACRGIRLRGVGDTRPAASLVRAVEHEALVAVMAERAGVAVPLGPSGRKGREGR
jgi:hypothetical protein